MSYNSNLMGLNGSFDAPSKPNLISTKTLKQLNEKCQIGGTHAPEWGTNIYDFYVTYIQPNMFPIIVFGLIILFLSIKYILKQERKKVKTNKSKHKKSKKIQNRHVISYGEDDIIDQEEVYDLPSIISDHYDDQSNLSQLNKYYDTLKQTGEMSDNMLNEAKEKDVARLSFDELARVVFGQP